jgi:malonyl-CoA decarboxylase
MIGLCRNPAANSVLLGPAVSRQRPIELLNTLAEFSQGVFWNVPATQVFRHALGNLSRLWRGIAAPFSDEEKSPSPAPDLPEEDVPRLRLLVEQCLEARGGEVSALGRAARLGRIYLELNQPGKRRFLETVAREFAADRAAVCRAAVALCATDADESTFLRAQEELRDVLVSPRLRLLGKFNALPQGVKFLIDLRADLLTFAEGDAHLHSLDRELRQLLATWFDIGFLELRRITWESPAALLEKLIAYEAVHEIHSWQDLRNRLESDRRCYAFFHPAMPDEPLIFIEVALVTGLARSIQELLDADAPVTDPLDADTAIFYSISNAQKGLRGISFGHFLIKQVVDDLRHDLPHLQTFATLSPIPGFGRWLRKEFAAGADDPLLADLQASLDEVLQTKELSLGPVEALENSEVLLDEARSGLLRASLERLCLHYLHERREDGFPLDPVERFHLGNGARIEQLNWLGDTSAKGLRQSCGMMVNYLYVLGDIEKNHEAFAAEKRIVVSRRIRSEFGLSDPDSQHPLRRLWRSRG